MKLFKTTPHKIDLFLVVLFPVAAAILTLVFQTNFLTTTLLFFGAPSVYLSFRRPGIVPKSLIVAMLSIPFVVIIDYLGVLNKSWYIPTTVFGFRLLDVIVIEQFVWGYLWAFSAIIFYEYFLDFGKRSDSISKNIKYLATFTLTLLAVFFLFLFIRPGLLHIEYFYLKGGVVLIFLPLITFLTFFPKFLAKYLKVGVYFFGLSLLFELVALHTHQWTFPGQSFIGFITLFGLRLPFEEVLVWFVLGVSGALSYYEFFVDDKK